MLHAAISLGALGWAKYFPSTPPLFPSHDSHSSSVKSFSLQHYNVAVRQLAGRVSSGDINSMEMAVVACIAFATIEHFLDEEHVIPSLIEWTWGLIKRHPRCQCRLLIGSEVDVDVAEGTTASFDMLIGGLSQLSNQIQLVQQFQQVSVA